MTTTASDPAQTATPHHARWYAAASGVAAAVAGAGVGHLVAGLVDPPSSPVVAVASAVVGATPLWLKDWAVATFGTADKSVLVAVVALVTMALAAGAGVVAARHRTSGLLLVVALAAAATLAAVLRPAAPLTAVIPGMVTGLVGVAVLAWAASRFAPAPVPLEARASMLTASSRPTVRGVQRRELLLGMGAATLVGGVAAAFGQRLGAVTAQFSRVLPRARKPLPPLPVGLEKTVPDVSALQTPTASFYRVDTALVIPRLDAADWRLSIDGEVDHPFSLSYDELLALPLVERDITLTCVSNEVGGDYAGGARWLGVEVAGLLARAGVRGGVDQILSTSTDGYTCSTPLAALTDARGSLIAVGMNGEPLSPTHGFPARLVTPGLYGYVGATKWLTTLTATTFAAQQAYWTQRGWAAQAPIKTMARIDTPRARASVPAGSGVVAGVAWAQGRGIERVEVQVDGGAWAPATLGPDVGIDYWRQWYLPWTPSPGQHTVAARAVDGTGAVQTTTQAPPAPDGASGLHTVVVTVA